MHSPAKSPTLHSAVHHDADITAGDVLSWARVDQERPLLQTTNLCIGYQYRAMLPPIQLRIQSGEMWCLVGRNGSGKSTLLRTLLGLHAPISGRIERFSTSLSYVPQRSDLDTSIPLRVVDYLRTGLSRGANVLNPFTFWMHNTAIKRAAEETAINTLLKEPLSSLSYGQQQRVLISRAWVSRPQLILLDEPTSAMDPDNEVAIFELLDHMRKEHGIGIFIASHSVSLVRRFCTHAILVDRDSNNVICGGLARVEESSAFQRIYRNV